MGLIVEGRAQLVGPDDPRPWLVDGELSGCYPRGLPRRVAHDDWDEYDRVMAQEQRAVVLITPTTSNGLRTQQRRRSATCGVELGWAEPAVAMIARSVRRQRPQQSPPAPHTKRLLLWRSTHPRHGVSTTVWLG